MYQAYARAVERNVAFVPGTTDEASLTRAIAVLGEVPDSLTPRSG